MIDCATVDAVHLPPPMDDTMTSNWNLYYCKSVIQIVSYRRQFAVDFHKWEMYRVYSWSLAMNWLTMALWPFAVPYGDLYALLMSTVW